MVVFCLKSLSFVIIHPITMPYMILIWKRLQLEEWYRESRSQVAGILETIIFQNMQKIHTNLHVTLRIVYGVDVLTVRNRKEREIYLVDLHSLFKIIKNNNISYKFIDAIYCRSAWLSNNAMSQSAYHI
ncbi:hypothetical protein B4907_22215 [Yersinia kristensenii]|nr:hypothetical protein B4907_22215 [Yersinia kristensenii]